MKKQLKSNGIFYIIISLVAVLAIGGIVNAFTNNSIEAPKVVNEGGTVNIYESEQNVPFVDGDVDFGGASGPKKNFRQYFYAGYQSGGDTFASSTTNSTETLVTADINKDVSYISYTANINTTLTTMASTSMSFIGKRTGDKRVYDFYSATTTAATTITIAAGTGVDLQEDEGGTVVINGLESARLTFIRKADSDVSLIVEVFQVGD